MRNSSDILSNETAHALKDHKASNLRVENEVESRMLTNEHLRNDLILNLNKKQFVMFESNQMKSVEQVALSPKCKEEQKREDEESSEKSIVHKNNYEAFKFYMECFLDHKINIFTMSFITIYILFENDVNELLPTSVDLAFQIMNIISFSAISLEFILCCIVRNNYIFHFFFWIDLLSVLTTISEVNWLFNPILEKFE
jgi:hypothetical protein